MTVLVKGVKQRLFSRVSEVFPLVIYFRDLNQTINIFDQFLPISFRKMKRSRGGSNASISTC